MYDKAIEAKSYIEKQFVGNPKTAIVLGSGLTSIMDELTDKVEILYEDIHVEGSACDVYNHPVIIYLLSDNGILPQ